MRIRNSNKKPSFSISVLTATYLDNIGGLKKFLARFFSSQQDIEDVMQEAYLRAFKFEQARAKDIEHPRAFLFRIARNVALTELMKKSRQITDYIEGSGNSAVIRSEANVENEVEALQTLGIYCEAVGTLPEKCRRVYLMRKVHGLPHKEIAKRMGLSVSSVEKYLIKGVRHCRVYVRDREAGCRVGTDASRSSIKATNKAK